MMLNLNVNAEPVKHLRPEIFLVAVNTKLEWRVSTLLFFRGFFFIISPVYEKASAYNQKEGRAREFFSGRTHYFWREAEEWESAATREGRLF